MHCLHDSFISVLYIVCTHVGGYVLFTEQLGVLFYGTACMWYGMGWVNEPYT